MRTRQEIFDIACKGLLTQMKKSEGAEKCLYRGPDGTKCAIGFLISDETAADFNESSVGSLPFRVIQNEIGLSGTRDNLYFLADLQAVHDSGEPEEWEGLLKALATKEGLVFNGRG